MEFSKWSFSSGKSSKQWSLQPAMSTGRRNCHPNTRTCACRVRRSRNGLLRKRRGGRVGVTNVDLGPLEMVEDLLTVYEGFLTMGVPLVIIHLNRIFPCKPSSYWGTFIIGHPLFDDTLDGIGWDPFPGWLGFSWRKSFINNKPPLFQKIHGDLLQTFPKNHRVGRKRTKSGSTWSMEGAPRRYEARPLATLKTLSWGFPSHPDKISTHLQSEFYFWSFFQLSWWLNKVL